jgi:hypothetical protein
MFVQQAPTYKEQCEMTRVHKPTLPLTRSSHMTDHTTSAKMIMTNKTSTASLINS